MPTYWSFPNETRLMCSSALFTQEHQSGVYMGFGKHAVSKWEAKKQITPVVFFKMLFPCASVSRLALCQCVFCVQMHTIGLLCYRLYL